MNDYIIDRPELQSPLQRATTRGITLVFWIFWIYLWLPLISLLAWVVGIRLFQLNLLENEGYLVLVQNSSAYGTVIALIALVLIVWARYNLYRFRSRETRRDSPPVPLATLAENFNIAAHDLAAWQQARRLVLHHDRNGGLRRIDVEH